MKCSFVLNIIGRQSLECCNTVAYKD